MKVTRIMYCSGSLTLRYKEGKGERERKIEFIKIFPFKILAKLNQKKILY